MKALKKRKSLEVSAEILKSETGAAVEILRPFQLVMVSKNNTRQLVEGPDFKASIKKKIK